MCRACPPPQLAVPPFPSCVQAPSWARCWPRSPRACRPNARRSWSTRCLRRPPPRPLTSWEAASWPRCTLRWTKACRVRRADGNRPRGQVEQLWASDCSSYGKPSTACCWGRSKRVGGGPAWRLQSTGAPWPPLPPSAALWHEPGMFAHRRSVQRGGARPFPRQLPGRAALCRSAGRVLHAAGAGATGCAAGSVGRQRCSRSTPSAIPCTCQAPAPI